MAIANPRIHIICGICGCNNEFSYNIKQELNDDNNMFEYVVYVSCGNCGSVTSLEELMEGKK